MEENMPVMLEIAKEMENMKLPSPELVAYYNDFNDRKIYITCDIVALWKCYIRCIGLQTYRVGINGTNKGQCQKYSTMCSDEC